MRIQPTVLPDHRTSVHFPALSGARLRSALATLRDALSPDEVLSLPATFTRSALLDVLSALVANASARTTNTSNLSDMSCADPANAQCQCPACLSVLEAEEGYIVRTAGQPFPAAA